MVTDLTKGSVVGNVVRFALPYMLSYFLQILYGLADMFFIGRYCDVDSITAVSNGAQVMHMFTVIIIGFAMGTTVRLGMALGAKDRAGMSKVAGNTIVFFIWVAVIALGLLFLLRDGIISALGVPQTAVPGTRDYLSICFAGVPFIIAYNVLASFFRGIGDSKSPMYFVMVACAANIILDYIFIGQCGLGPLGAALGTTLSQIISVVVSAVFVYRHRATLGLDGVKLRLERKVISAILKVGAPIALQDGFVQISFIAITVIANARGVVDSAAVGIVEKFIGLLFIMPSAMLATISAVSAQCFGAGNGERARKTMATGMCISAAFGVVASTVLQFIPDLAVSIFTSDANVIAEGGEYLRSYSLDCFFASFQFCFSGFFTAAGYSILSFLHNFLAIILVRIPLSFLASVTWPDTLYPMGFASPIGSIFSSLFCLTVFIILRKKGKV